MQGRFSVSKQEVEEQQEEDSVCVGGGEGGIVCSALFCLGLLENSSE